MDKKALISTAGAYVLWGFLPLYWQLLSGYSALFVLANRIIWSAIFTITLLAINKSLPALKATLKNKNMMKFLVPASIFVTINWGIYIYAVSSGMVQDASFGYYINPLFVGAFGILLFKERCTKYDLIAFALALTGVIYLIVQFGRIPYISLALGLSFTLYGACKKTLHMDSTLSVAIETLLFTPIALLFLIFSDVGKNAIGSLQPVHISLLIIGGMLTSIPIMLYTGGVNALPFLTVGFFQYISPTLMLIISFLQGESFQKTRIIGFVFIWIALIVFSVGMVKKYRDQKREDNNISGSPVKNN